MLCFLWSCSFDDELGGVLLAYWREKMASKKVHRAFSGSWYRPVLRVSCAGSSCSFLHPQGRILDITPYVSVRVSVHALLFKPRVGTDLGTWAAFARGVV
jgi:hypothetical protein